MFSLWEVTRAAIDEASKLLQVQLRGSGAEGDASGSEAAADQPVFEPLGVSAFPTARSTLRALGLRRGAEVLVLALWDKAKRVADLAEGEIAFHGLERVDAALRILATGKINLKSAAGQDLVFNDGTLKVARETDPVHAGTVSAICNGFPVQFIYTPYGGAPSAAAPLLVLSGGKITGGADDVKA
jgi:hypothetical protein